jgi:hypothetical protein
MDHNSLGCDVAAPNELRLDVAAKKQDLGPFNCAATSSRVELSRFRDDAALLGI